MADYDYGNARLRAMKSRLLSRREIQALAEVGSLQGLITALTSTAYRKPIEAALARTSGMDCIAESLRNDLINTLGKIRQFYSGEAGDIVAIVLRTCDIHNLKTILRGLSRDIPAGEIPAILLPVGDLDSSTLVELTRSPGPRGAIDLLASMNMPIVQPLLKLRAEHPGADIFEMELALDQWYYREARQYLENSHADDLMSSALKLDADIANILTVLRFAHAPAEHKIISQRFETGDLTRLLVGPGRLPFTLLAQAGGQDTVEAAVNILAGTVYEPPLRLGLEAYTKSNRLSDLEKQLRRFRLAWMSTLIAKDPLGIGVVLGYMALKINEVSNIRWIALGINLGLNSASIKADLEFIA